MSIRAWNDRAWVIETQETTYLVDIGDEGLPVQRYWGPLLAETDIDFALRSAPSRGQPENMGDGGTIDEILVVGGVRIGLANFDVTYPGGVRNSELAFTSATIVGPESRHLVLTLQDAKFSILVRLNYRIRRGSDIVERWTEVEAGAELLGAAVIHRLDSANWSISDEIDYRYSAVSGAWGQEFQLTRQSLPFGELSFTSRTGISGHNANPWVMIDDGTATETSGRVRSIVLGWSGTWRLTAQRRTEGGVSVSAGFGHDHAELVVNPGTTIVTPPSFGLVSDGGFGAASRAWHRFARDVQIYSGEIRPVLYNSWYATRFSVSEENQLALASKAASVGAELFVIDDGWFSDRVDERGGLGDWWVDARRFPSGLRGFSDRIHQLGMQFGLWVEPEMVNPNSELYREHPQWVLHLDGRNRRELRNQLVLNFARPEVAEWAFGWLHDLVVSANVDYLKWDFNRPFSQAGWPGSERESGSLFERHIRAVYRIMDRLRASHPDLRIESCAAGGGRADFGMMPHVDQFWPSDNTDALDLRTIHRGFTQTMPTSTMAAWVTDDPDKTSGRTVPLSFRARVAMTGVMGIGADLTTWSDDDLLELRQLVTQYKEVRESVQFGELYRLDGPGTVRGEQYIWGDQATVIIFEAQRSLDRSSRYLPLEGLEPESLYSIDGIPEAISGAYLMSRGLTIDDFLGRRNSRRFSGSDYASAVVQLARVRASPRGSN